jgi:hypothetical protein
LVLGEFLVPEEREVRAVELEKTEPVVQQRQVRAASEEQEVQMVRAGAAGPQQLARQEQALL